jgi:hypothetical protein
MYKEKLLVLVLASYVLSFCRSVAGRDTKVTSYLSVKGATTLGWRSSDMTCV